MEIFEGQKLIPVIQPYKVAYLNHLDEIVHGIALCIIDDEYVCVGDAEDMAMNTQYIVCKVAGHPVTIMYHTVVPIDKIHTDEV